MLKRPNTRTNLDRAIQRLYGQTVKFVNIRSLMANAIDRRMQSWPAVVVKNANWETIYDEERGVLPVLPTVDEAVAWANDLIVRIDAAKEDSHA